MGKKKYKADDVDFIPGFTKDNHGEIGRISDIKNSPREDVYKALFDTLSSPHKSLADQLQAKKRKEMIKGNITINDVFNIQGFSDIELFELIAGVIGLENMDSKRNKIGDSEIVITPQGIQKINNLMNQAVEFYEQVLYRTVDRSIFVGKGKKFNFKSEKDILKFITSTSQSSKPAVRQIRCSLLKLAYVINENDKIYKNHLELAEAEKVFNDLFGEIIAPEFNITPKNRDKPKFKSVEDVEDFYFYTKHHGEVFSNYAPSREICASFSCRTKSKKSSIIKFLYNANYGEIELLKDFYAITSEVEDPLESLLMLQYAYFKFTAKNKRVKIKNKGMITEELLEQYKDKLNPDFYIKLKETLFSIPKKVMKVFEKKLPQILIYQIKKNKVLTKELLNKIKPFFGERFIKYLEKNVVIFSSPGSNKKYSNASLEFDIEYGGKNHPIEWQIVTSDNKNESGYNNHHIYDGLKIIATMIRLQGYVTIGYVKRVISKKIEENPDLLALGSGDKSKTINNIFDYFVEENKIVQIRVSGNDKQKYFTISNRRKELNKDGMYPEGLSLAA